MQHVQQVAELAATLVGAAMLSLVEGHTAEAGRLLARARLLHAPPSTRALWHAIAREE